MARLACGQPSMPAWRPLERGATAFANIPDKFAVDEIESTHHLIAKKGIAMRTTLDIDEDVLAAAKELARRQRMSTGRMVSRLLRQGLTGQGATVSSSSAQDAGVCPAIGFRPFAARKMVTNDQVNALRESEGV